MGVGHPASVFEQLSGVPVGECGVPDQEGHDQPDADQHALVEGPSHSPILERRGRRTFIGTSIVVDGAGGKLRAHPSSAGSQGPILSDLSQMDAPFGASAATPAADSTPAGSMAMVFPPRVPPVPPAPALSAPGPTAQAS